MEYRIAPDVLVAKLHGEAVLLDVRSKNYFQLNATAAAIWSALEQGRTATEIMDELSERYEAPREQIEEEAKRLLDAMRERGLIVAAGSGEPA